MPQSIVADCARSVAAAARDVAIRPDGVRLAAQTILDNMRRAPFRRAAWRQHALHPQSLDDAAVAWIFTVDLLNFSFWHERSARRRFAASPSSEANDPHSGYWSLCACIRRAINEGVPITSPSFWVTASDDALKDAFRPDDPIAQDPMPLIDQRIALMRFAGKILVEKFNGKFTECIAQAQKSAQSLISLVIHHFGDAFEDAVDYNGQRIYFRKRVQILVADLWACFDGKSFGEFNDINTITMFADYRVPQALLYFGVIEYTPELESVLRKHEAYHDQYNTTSDTTTVIDTTENAANMIPRGHRYEVEIRACSIWAVELLVKHIREAVSTASRSSPDAITTNPDEINAIVVDFFLWDEAYRNKDAMAHLPIHRTRSIYY